MLSRRTDQVPDDMLEEVTESMARGSDNDSQTSVKTSHQEPLTVTGSNERPTMGSLHIAKHY